MYVIYIYIYICVCMYIYMIMKNMMYEKQQNKCRRTRLRQNKKNFF